jgi:hypothetical protein
MPDTDLGITDLCNDIIDAIKAAREDAFNRICKKGCCGKIAINVICGSQNGGGMKWAAKECKVCSGGYARYEVDCNGSDAVGATIRTHGTDYDIDDPTRDW